MAPASTQWSSTRARTSAPSGGFTYRCCLREPDDGGFYVFADAEQAIYRDGWEPPFQGIEFELTTNCRNTLPIASLVVGLYGRKVHSLGAAGPEPSFTPIARKGEIKGAVRRVLYRLIHEDKVPAGEIAVLSPSKPIVDAPPRGTETWQPASKRAR